MTCAPPTTLPIFAVTDVTGRQVHLVMSVGTFRDENGLSPETLIPIVEDTLNLAQELSGSELLHSFYLLPGPGEQVVEIVRNVLKRSFAANRPVLWLRADTEQFLRAALSIVRVEYPAIRVVNPCHL